MINSLSRRWTLSKAAAAAAFALVAMVAGVPGANAMFSASSDVVQVRNKERLMCTVYSTGNTKTGQCLRSVTR